jgi:hypothetical protein
MVKVSKFGRKIAKTSGIETAANEVKRACDVA